MIKADKIKNKKELYFISQKQNFIMKKTIELNKKGIYNNIKLIIKEEEIYFEAINNISKGTLISVIGGKIYYLKNVKHLFSKENKKFNEPILLLYFKTANCNYDRYIKLSENSTIKYFFSKNNSKDSNLDILKIVDLEGYIELIIISNKLIEKGEKLKINNKNEFNL